MTVRTLVIDGRHVSAREGETLLDLCREHGVPLPTLCHLEGLGDVGACRLCLVEVKGHARLAAACTTRAEEGMDVVTDSPRLRGYRRQLVELLLAERNHACAVCVENGHCELQRVAVEVGVDHVRFDYRHPATTLDASHPRFVLDHARCVLCTRCVRVCAEIEGAHTWDVAGRGAATRIVCDLDGAWGESETCTACGKCVRVCPTGALFEKAAVGTGAAAAGPDFLAWLRTAREGREGGR